VTIYSIDMQIFVLILRPYGNIRKQIWMLKRKSFDWTPRNSHDVLMALPEGIVCGLFEHRNGQRIDHKNRDFLEHVQRTLVRHSQEICKSFPDIFALSAVEKNDDHTILKLDKAIDSQNLDIALELFAEDADLKVSENALFYGNKMREGIWFGNGCAVSLDAAISFKKYELMLYLAELPEASFCGFHFRAFARVYCREKMHSHSKEDQII